MRRQRDTQGCLGTTRAYPSDGAARGSLAVLEYVHGLGVACGAVNVHGHSPLHKAAIYGQAAVCDYLLERTPCCTRAQVMAGGTNERPSHMADFNGFRALAARLRHVENVLHLVRVHTSL